MREFDGRGEHWQTRSGAPTSSPPSRKDLAESAGYRVTPADQEPKLAAQCVRMARFLETQHATLDAKVEALADAVGWSVDDTWVWIDCEITDPDRGGGRDSR